MAIEKWLNSIPDGLIEKEIRSVMEKKGGSVDKSVDYMADRGFGHIIGSGSGEMFIAGWFVQFGSDLKAADFIKVLCGWGSEPVYVLSLAQVMYYLKNNRTHDTQLRLL
jgi:hypothetical protein